MEKTGGVGESRREAMATGVKPAVSFRDIDVAAGVRLGLAQIIR